MRDIHAGVRRFACSGVRWTRFFAGCGQRLGWAWACNHREPPRAFGDRRAVDREGSGDRDRPPSETIVGVASAGHADGSRFPAKGRPALSSLKFDGSWSRREGWTGNRVMLKVPTGRRPCHQSDRTNSPPGSGRRVFCQVGVGRFGVSFSPCERRVSGRFGVGRSCWLLVIALVIA